MADDKNIKNAPSTDGNETKNNNSNKQETIHVHNPFKPEEEKEITPEELENIEKFKEAQTERD